MCPSWCAWEFQGVYAGVGTLEKSETNDFLASSESNWNHDGIQCLCPFRLLSYLGVRAQRNQRHDGERDRKVKTALADTRVERGVSRGVESSIEGV